MAMSPLYPTEEIGLVSRPVNTEREMFPGGAVVTRPVGPWGKLPLMAGGLTG